MSRRNNYRRRYGVNASAVLRSIARVARAGKSGDPFKIEAERARHYSLMASLP